MSTATMFSPPNLATSCANGQPQVFSPNCAPTTNGLSRLGSIILSPLHAPNLLDTQLPSPLKPLDILSPDGLEKSKSVGTICRWTTLILLTILTICPCMGSLRCRSHDLLRLPFFTFLLCTGRLSNDTEDFYNIAHALVFILNPIASSRTKSLGTHSRASSI